MKLKTKKWNTILLMLLLLITYGIFSCKKQEEIANEKLSATEIAKLSIKNTVVIYGEFVEDDPIFDDKQKWKGSGFFFLEDEDSYHILTNLHVVGIYLMYLSDKTVPEIKHYNLTVFNYNKEKLPIKQVLINKYFKDMAIIVVEKTEKHPVLSLKREVPAIGTKVYAIGHPLGYEYNFTSGIVSGYETIDNLKCIRTDASINPGNSGGALLDEYGKVVGMNTWKAIEGDNIGFAISSLEILKSIDNDEFIPFPFNNPKKITKFFKRYK